MKSPFGEYFSNHLKQIYDHFPNFFPRGRYAGLLTLKSMVSDLSQQNHPWEAKPRMVFVGIGFDCQIYNPAKSRETNTSKQKSRIFLVVQS